MKKIVDRLVLFSYLGAFAYFIAFWAQNKSPGFQANGEKLKLEVVNSLELSGDRMPSSIQPQHTKSALDKINFLNESETASAFYMPEIDHNQTFTAKCSSKTFDLNNDGKGWEKNSPCTFKKYNLISY